MAVKISDHFTFKRLIRFVAPCIAMMIVTSVYSIVDGFFVSNFAGKNAFAAVNLIMPVLMGLSAFGFMIGTGGSALVAFTFGQGKKERANQIFSMLIELVFLAGVTVSILGSIFMPQIVRALGASDLIFADSVLYGRIMLISLTFYMMQNSFQSFLATAERAKMGLMISVAMGLLNMFLDFLFVYVLHLGIAGAGIATAIAEILGGTIPFLYFARENTSRLRFHITKPDFRAIRKACANGSSEMLTNLSTSIVGILYNFQLMKYAAENGVAAYGVVMYVSFIFMAFYFGYAIGIGPVIGYHYGAGHRDELKNLLRKSLLVTTVAAVVMTCLGQFGAGPIAQVFVGYDAELLAITARALQIYSFAFLINGFNIFGSAFFTGLNNGKISAMISVLRTLVIQVSAILILPIFFGIDGVWCAIIVAEGITLFITVFFLLAKQKKYGY